MPDGLRIIEPEYDWKHQFKIVTELLLCSEAVVDPNLSNVAVHVSC
jgi:hypothetical protein